MIKQLMLILSVISATSPTFGADLASSETGRGELITGRAFGWSEQGCTDESMVAATQEESLRQVTMRTRMASLRCQYYDGYLATTQNMEVQVYDQGDGICEVYATVRVMCVNSVTELATDDLLQSQEARTTRPLCVPPSLPSMSSSGRVQCVAPTAGPGRR